MGIIPTFVHAIFSYILALALILLPQVFGVQGAADLHVALGILAGGGIFITCLFTDFELALVRVVPIRILRIVEGVAGAGLLLAAPGLGLTGRSLVAFVGTALCLIVLSVFSQDEPELLEHRRRPT